MHIAFIGYGEVGRILAEDLRAAGHSLRAFDLKLLGGTGMALRAHADIPLLVSAHDERLHIEPLLYHSALQHLLDRVFILLCEADSGRRARLQGNLQRIQPLLEN